MLFGMLKLKEFFFFLLEYPPGCCQRSLYHLTIPTPQHEGDAFSILLLRFEFFFFFSVTILILVVVWCVHLKHGGTVPSLLCVFGEVPVQIICPPLIMLPGIVESAELFT